MGISFWSLLVILLIILVLFGGKRLRHIGEDLGAALKSFRKGLQEEEEEEPKRLEYKEKQPPKQAEKQDSETKPKS